VNHDSSPKLPFNETSWASFGTATHSLSDKYSFSDSQVHMIDFLDIASDSHEIGTGVYEGLTMNSTVP
jgi:hypothetical protein